MALKKRKVRALSREEARNRYEGSAFKRELRDDFKYDRVQELYSSFYAGLDPRRRQEMADGGMVREDKNAMSNLPKEGYQKEYPRAGYYSSPYIDDSVEG